MIKFVVCDDDIDILENVSKIIDKTMFQNKIMYEKSLFNEYNNEFLQIAHENSNKIFILDIEVKNKSGIDIARQIRKTDRASVIIFLTSHMEEGYSVLKGDFMCLSFISKLDNYKKHLERTLKSALLVAKEKSISLNDKGITYNIKLNEILYIYREKSERKTSIIMNNRVIKINKTLDYLYKETGFFKTHRSALVNKERVLLFDFKNKKIVFDNNTESDYLTIGSKDLQ